MTAFLRRCWLTACACLDWRHRNEAHVMSPVHCANCGHGCVAVLPASSPAYNAELGIVDMLECPQCGLYTVCSD